MLKDFLKSFTIAFTALTGFTVINTCLHCTRGGTLLFSMIVQPWKWIHNIW